MRIGEYIASRLETLCLLGIGGLYICLVSYFCRIPTPVTIILLGSGAFAVIVWLVTGWWIANRKLKNLRSRLEALPEKYLIGETLARPKDAVEQQYFLLMKEISRSAIGAVDRARAEKEEYSDYVEQWVHEIKTPLTACSLILANGGDPAKLRRELRRADNLSDTILHYAKLCTVEKDLQIGAVDLRTACDQAVREEMELLIAAGIAVSVQGAGRVYTDPKLLVFVLKQLLINCAKYCAGCQIQMILAENSLVFEDNGPGIPAHELSRVTDRGFTGTLGRSTGKSTGMGLYIVKRLCEKMSVGLEPASREGEFTRFTFTFCEPTTNLTEMLDY